MSDHTIPKAIGVLLILTPALWLAWQMLTMHP
jgi:hypothetical protein